MKFEFVAYMNLGLLLVENWSSQEVPVPLIYYNCVLFSFLLLVLQKPTKIACWPKITDFYSFFE